MMRKSTTEMIDLHPSNTGEEEREIRIAGLTFFDMHRSPRRLFEDSITTPDGVKAPATISVPDDTIDSLFREDLKCGVCLGTLNVTLTITQCFHRFCSECLHRSLRMELGPKSHHECPSCRAKLASRRASKPDMKYDSLIRLISINGRKRSMSISPPVDSDASPVLKMSRAVDDSSKLNPTSKPPLRKEPVQPHRLDLEKYRIAHLEKVNEFRERQAKMLSTSSHKPDRKTSHKAKTGGSNYKGYDEKKHQQAGKSSGAKGSYPSSETAVAGAPSQHAKVWMSLFPLPEWVPDSMLQSISYDTSAVKSADNFDLAHPYLKMPPHKTIFNLKAYLSAKLKFVDPSKVSIEIIANFGSKVTLEESLTIHDVTTKYWDCNSELKLYFQFHTNR